MSEPLTTPNQPPAQTPSCFPRRSVYLLLTVAVLATTAARMMEVQSADRRTPFLSANDRSRWATVRALVDEGTYAIDRVIVRRGWDTIDKVRHRGKDGQLHFYSSKPPLFPTLLAGEYWALKKVTGATLGRNPFYIGRLMLLITNGLSLAILLAALWKVLEWLGRDDWSRLVVAVAATFGTFLTTFAVTINNHLPAAVGVALSLVALVRIERPPRASWGWYMLAGLGAGWAVANELPALSWLVVIGLLLALRDVRRMAAGYLPVVAVVAAAFFGTNWLAHGSLSPPYMHRQAGENWYDYPESYWLEGNREGIDRGEPSRLVYAFHVLVGHHGVLSLTPLWILSLLGSVRGLAGKDPTMRIISAIAILLTSVCMAFYISRPLIDRNYGGMTVGFRWLIWLIPVWLVTLLPALEWLGRFRWGRCLTYVCLAVSVFSAHFSAMNPWSHPWLYRYWETLGWL